MFWSGEQRILIRLGSFLYDTSREVGGIKMLSKGSDLNAVENVVGKIVDKQVMAGWRSVTRGTTSFGFDFYWPVRTPILSLLAMEAR